MTCKASMANANDTDASIDIAAAGDIMFAVGLRPRRLKVHSLVLKNASPVFNVMLGPSFKEGYQLSQPGLTEIPLPEDNAEAI